MSAGFIAYACFYDFVVAFQECWYVFQQLSRHVHIISEHYIWQKSSPQAVCRYRVQSKQLRLYDLTSNFYFAMAAEHISLYHRDTLHLIIHLPQGKTFLSITPSRHQKETYCHCVTGQMLPVPALMEHIRLVNSIPLLVP